MKKIIVALVIAVLLISSFPAIIFAAPPDKTAPVSDFSQEQILVKFKSNVSLPEVAEVHRQLGGQVKGTIPDIGVQVVAVPKGQATAKVRAYSANAKVAYAEPDFVVQALDTPNDPGFVNQWGMVRVQAPQAWDVTTGSPSITIAILDTGVDTNHPDLASKIVKNINFSGSPTADDVYGHGTHVAGIAAAITNNGIGVAGLGYTSTIMNVKVLGDNGVGYWSWVAQGIVWAADHGAKIINLSLGGPSGSTTVEGAINYAWSKGVVVVAAAGNYGNSAPCYPAYYTNCIAVAATDSRDRLAGWSDYGGWVDVAAPGVNIVSTYLTSVNGGYRVMSGTSMASPHVAGLAALVFTVVTDSNGNGRLNDEVRAQIQANCDDIGVSGIGSGLIDAYKAVASGSRDPTPPTGSIAGEVTDAANSSPIAGATVSGEVGTALTDVNGQFVISGVPEGTYTLTGSTAGYSASSQAVSVVAGQTTTANFALTKLLQPGSITGKVTDAADASPIVGATVSCNGASVVTNSNGQFTVTNLPQGAYTVAVSAGGYADASQVVSVVAGQTATANFALTKLAPPVPQPLWVLSITFGMTGKNLRLSINIVSESGAVAGAQVAVQLTNGVQGWSFTGTTDSSGTASFTVNKAPAGTYLASVTAVTAAGYTWDTTQGMVSATYVLKGGGGRK
jgi:thermitase